MSYPILKRLAQGAGMALVAFAFMAVGVPQADAFTQEGDVCIVYPTDSRTTIQNLLNNTTCNTVRFAGGTFDFGQIYGNTFTVSRSVNIEGSESDPAIIKVDGPSFNSALFYVTAGSGSTVEISGLRAILNEDIYYGYLAFVRTYQSYANLDIHDNHVTGHNNWYGISLFYRNYGSTVISDNVFDGSWYVDTIYVYRYYGYAPLLIENNTFSGSIASSYGESIRFVYVYGYDYPGRWRPQVLNNSITTSNQNRYYDFYYSARFDVTVPYDEWYSGYQNDHAIFYGCSGYTFTQAPPDLLAIDDEASTDENAPVAIDVLANDSGLSLSVDSFTQPDNGTVTQSGNLLTYTADSGFVGTDTFEYTAIDANSNTDTAEVTVAVHGTCNVSASDDGGQFWGPDGLMAATENLGCDNIVLGPGVFHFGVEQGHSLDHKTMINHPTTIEGTVGADGSLLTLIEAIANRPVSIFYGGDSEMEGAIAIKNIKAEIVEGAGTFFIWNSYVSNPSASYEIVGNEFTAQMDDDYDYGYCVRTQSNNLVPKGSVISNNVFSGCNMEIVQQHGVTVSDNEFSHITKFNIQYARSITVSNNVFSEFGQFILSGNTGVTITGNTVHGSEYPPYIPAEKRSMITLRGDRYDDISDNVFSNVSAEDHLILLKEGAYNNVIANNSFSGSAEQGEMVMLMYSHNNEISGNSFAVKTRYSVFYLYRSNSNTVSGNELARANLLEDPYHHIYPYHFSLYQARGNTIEVPCGEWYDDYVAERVYQIGSSYNSFNALYPANGVCPALDQARTLETNPVSVDVLANDKHRDGLALSLDSFGQPANGTVSQDGQELVYQADGGFYGDDKFAYTVSDTLGEKGSADVLVDVQRTCVVSATNNGSEFWGPDGVRQAVDDKTCATVRLGAGTFDFGYGGVTVNIERPVVIEGTVDASGTLLTTVQAETGCLISASNVTGTDADSEKLIVRNLKAELEFPATLVSFYAPLYENYDRNNTKLEEVSVTGNQIERIGESTGYGFPLVSVAYPDAIISENSLSGAALGISAGGFGTTVSDNVINLTADARSSRYGVSLSESPGGAEISGNQISGASYGIIIDGSYYAEISGNQFTNVDYGIQLYYSSHHELRDNVFTDGAAKNHDYYLFLSLTDNNSIHIPCLHWYPDYVAERILFYAGASANAQAYIGPSDTYNCAPVAQPDSLDSGLQAHDRLIPVADLLANDYDPNDPDILNVGEIIGTPVTAPASFYDLDLDLPSLATEGGNALRLLEEDGIKYVAYLPGPYFTGADSFQYEVCDEEGLCDIGTASLTVEAYDTGVLSIHYDRHYTGSGKEGQKQPQEGAEIYIYERSCPQGIGLQKSNFSQIYDQCDLAKMVRYTDAAGNVTVGLEPGDYVIFAIDIDEAQGVHQINMKQANNLKTIEKSKVKDILLQGVIDPALSRSILNRYVGQDKFSGLNGQGTPPSKSRGALPSVELNDGSLRVTIQTSLENPETGAMELVPANGQVKAFAADDACLTGKDTAAAFAECSPVQSLRLKSNKDGQNGAVLEAGSYRLLAWNEDWDSYAGADVEIIAAEETAAVFTSTVEEVVIEGQGADLTVIVQAQTGDATYEPLDSEVKLYESADACLEGKELPQAFEECPAKHRLNLNSETDGQATVELSAGTYKMVLLDPLAGEFIAHTVTLTNGHQMTVTFTLNPGDADTAPTFTASESASTPRETIYTEPVVSSTTVDVSQNDVPLAVAAPSAPSDTSGSTTDGSSTVLAQGDTLWGTVLTFARKVRQVTTEQVKSLAKLVAQKNSVSVPEWGISGLVPANQMRVGTRLDLSPLMSWLAGN